MEAKTAIGERIKGIRTKNNLSGEAFGVNLGMTKAGISAIEKGKNYPAIETVLKIAEIFQEDVNWILTGVKQDQTLQFGNSGTINKNTSSGNTVSVGTVSANPGQSEVDRLRERVQFLEEKIALQEKIIQLLTPK